MTHESRSHLLSTNHNRFNKIKDELERKKNETYYEINTIPQRSRGTTSPSDSNWTEMRALNKKVLF
jgi:hypothetical protein